MASVNKVILIGNLGRDPETRYAPSGSAICNVRIATTRNWKDKASGEKREETEWHSVVFYDRLAEIAGEYLKKGRPVYVEGRLKTRKWQDKDGQDRYTTEIIATEMQLLGNRIVLAGTLSMFVLQAANLGLSVYLPVYLQSYAGLTAGESGVGMLGLLLGTVFGATMSGRMVARVVHYKRIATFGVTFAIACLLVMAYLADSASLLVVELLTVAAGIGTGTTFPVITVSVQNAVDQMHLGVATGLLTFLRSLGAALGVALLGAVALAYDLPLMGEGTSIGTALSSAAPFAMIFLACAAMLAASLVALGLMPEKPLRGSGHAEAPVLVE